VPHGFLILSAVLLPFVAAAQDSVVNQALPGIAKAASGFWQLAPGYLGRETLKQKALTFPKRKLRIGNSAMKPVKPEFKDREIVSFYALSSVASAREALHEFRQIVSVDGKAVLDANSAREKFRAALDSKDDREKKSLLEDFNRANLTVAATDFGQLVLLFIRAHLERYTFELQGTEMVGADRASVIGFRQNVGPQGLRITEPGRKEKEPLLGTILVRQSDFQPLRITLNAKHKEDKEEIRDEARVDYALHSDGVLLPASVVYRRYVNDGLVVENIYEYSDWQPVSAK